jgi:hypothetical protein
MTAELFPDNMGPMNRIDLTSGTIFFILQTVRMARDSGAETVRTLERYGCRGSELHKLAVNATNAMEIYRQRLAVEYEIRSRLERSHKR